MIILSSFLNLYNRLKLYVSCSKCQKKGGHLLHVDSKEEKMALEEFLFSLPHVVEEDPLELITGLYHDPHSLYSTLDSGRKL